MLWGQSAAECVQCWSFVSRLAMPLAGGSSSLTMWQSSTPPLYEHMRASGCRQRVLLLRGAKARPDTHRRRAGRQPRAPLAARQALGRPRALPRRRRRRAQRGQALLDARGQRRARGLRARPALEAGRQPEREPDKQVRDAVRGLERLHLGRAARRGRRQRGQQRRARHSPAARPVMRS